MLNAEKLPKMSSRTSKLYLALASILPITTASPNNHESPHFYKARWAYDPLASKVMRAHDHWLNYDAYPLLNSDKFDPASGLPKNFGRFALLSVHKEAVRYFQEENPGHQQAVAYKTKHDAVVVGVTHLFDDQNLFVEMPEDSRRYQIHMPIPETKSLVAQIGVWNRSQGFTPLGDEFSKGPEVDITELHSRHL